MVRLLENWRHIRARLRKAEGISLFLDFDGTLARIKPRPEQAGLDPATRRVLRRLAHSRRVRVCVISGRRLDDLRHRVGVSGIEFLGLHGWEEEYREKLTVPDRKPLQHARYEIASKIRHLDGVWIEDKQASFSVHYRGSDGCAGTQARLAAASAVGCSGGLLQLLEGDQVAEIASKEIHDKGVAARRHSQAFRRTLPVYAGNDSTDEPAFQALANGVTIRVGPRRPSRAQFSLRDPAEMRQFLEQLLKEVA